MPMVADVPTCAACGCCYGYDILKMPGGGPWAARCKGCGAHNDPVELGYHLEDIVDVGPFEERWMAKQKEKSRLELLAEQQKNGQAPRRVNRGPRYEFPRQKLAALLKRIGLKRGAVALEAGLDVGLVAAALKGENVRLAVALKLAKVAGMSVEELFGDPEIAGEVVSLNETPPPELPVAGAPIENCGGEA